MRRTEFCAKKEEFDIIKLEEPNFVAKEEMGNLIFLVNYGSLDSFM